MRSIWKFPITRNSAELTAPVLCLPQFVAFQPAINIFCVWAEVDTAEPDWSCIVTVHGTGHLIASDEHYIGTVLDGEFVWHYFATTPHACLTSN